MTVCIDGIIFSLQKHGGITVYFRELLSHLITLEVPVRLTLELPLAQDIKSVSKRLESVSRKARVFERYRSCRLGKGGSVFHSTYYRSPSPPAIPKVVTVHDFIYERTACGPRRWVHMHQKHSAIRQAQALICVSESTREDLLTWVGVRADQVVHVIPNGVSSIFRPIPVKPSEEAFILFVGGRAGYKNFSFILDALHYLPDFKLYCVGGGPLRDDEFRGRNLNVKDRVRYLGFISDKELNIAYNQAVCLVYPSRYEGFGIPVVEAMRAGCPVISLNCKAVVELGADALERLDDEDPKALAESVNRLCELAYREQRVLVGLERSKTYDWSRCHDQTLSVYESLLG
jgi:mannosyltransferase